LSQARCDLANGDDRLAKDLAVSAARQLAMQTRHYADEMTTLLKTLRKTLAENPGEKLEATRERT
jgi:hemerythrin-like domain-containing protein